MYDGYHKYGAAEARNYDADRESEPLWALENAYVARCLSGRSMQRLLDAPVGTGRFFDYYDGVAEIVGLDVSDDMLAQAAGRPIARQSGRVSLHRGDIKALTFPDGYFDIVVCWRLLHLIPEKMLVPMLGELRRVCAGELIVQVYRRGSFRSLQYRRLRRLPSTLGRLLGMSASVTKPWSHIQAYFHSQRCLDKAFAVAGLETVKCDLLENYEGHDVCVYHLRSRTLA